MFNFTKSIFTTLLITINFIYAKADITVSSKITEVMVYQQFAQITANADVNIVPGTYNLIVDNLSQYTNEGSLQLKGDANFVILSISTQMNYLGEEKKSRQLIALEDSIDRLTSKISANNSQIEVYTAEHDMIIANQKISGANNGVTTLELEKMANFYSSFATSRNYEANFSNVFGITPDTFYGKLAPYLLAMAAELK